MPRSVRRLFAALAPVVVGSVAIVGAGGLALALPPSAAAASQTVQITDSAFATPVLTIQVGDTVTWTNADDRPHTVTAGDGSFDSGNIDEGGTFSFTFTTPGTYAYLCQYHPDMTGTIVVEAASAPAAPAGGGATAAAPSQHGGHDAAEDQPDTAVDAPGGGIPLASYLLWGVGLVLLAVRFLPIWARRAVTATRPPGGWRR